MKRTLITSPLFFPALLLLAVLLLTGCGTKKNTPVSRQWQAFNTRYNVYYNGKTHYDEQLSQMEKSYQDDYTRMVLIHPAEARADAKRPQPGGDFNRTIEKMQKSIQLHSIKKKPRKKGSSAKEKAFRARDEFNPFLHNSWLTMAKSQYYNGDFLGAAATFYYIEKHFKWLPKVVTEARLWMALCYCALDWNYEAENAMHLVKENDLVNKNLKNLYNLAHGDYLLRTDQYEAAIPYLLNAAKMAHGSQKNRLWFLLGQLYSQLNQRKNAYEAFKKAGSGASTDYRTKFNARIKRSEVYEGSNVKKEVNSLKSMARYARNKEFLDQIYYAIGNLYLSRGDTTNALANYRLAVEKSTRNGIDKALAQLALGNLYFRLGEYVKAQPCYSEAVPQLPETYPDYKMLRRRSDVLDELALYAGNVHLQDSLLTLAKMTPEEQREACQRLVDELIAREKKEAEEAKREEYLSQMEGKGDENIKKDEGSASSFMMNTDKSWYFYNSMTKNQGKTEFQRRWGSRKLEDDWRRRNKTTYSLNNDEEYNYEEKADSLNVSPDNSSLTPEQQEEARQKLVAENDPHQVEYYLKQIPKTPAEIQTANDVIQEGLYNMGIILKDKLEDYSAARREFNRLLERYPDNVYRLDVYYNMYLMAVRRGQTAEAEKWRRLILEQFPDSPYGRAMLDPNYFDNLRRMNDIQESMYERAYSAYLADNNSVVHSLTEEMQKDYPLSKILPKFVFINALSYLTENEPEKFKQELSMLLERWPDTDMTDMAGGIMKGLKAGRVPRAGLSNTRGMIWSMRLSNDSTAASLESAANFERDPNAPQYLVLAFPRDSVNANQLLYDVARFNFSSFVVRDFDLEPMSFGNVGLLIIKGFENMKQLEHYRSVMARKEFELPEGVRPIMISKANFELLLREGRSFEEYFRFEEDSSVEATENAVLEAETPPEDTPPAEPASEGEAASETEAASEAKPASEAEAVTETEEE
ncbi:MAG: tetratricopeptide repeat protein [Candidatus Amulumruptor caecigallinarius]|nr:tetratricopeptide repeat protein [Candidatus Amulumruptor caecigallinarius]